MDLTAFCDRVYAVLQGAIQAEIATQQSLTSQQIEQNAHDTFRDERGRLVIGRDEVLNRVGAYIHSDNQTPLVLYGQSGVGKSSIMARAIPENALYRFIGATPQSSDIRQMVYGLCEHIVARYGISETIPQDYEELIEAFPKFLASASADKPLVIFLDALDQLSNTNAPYNLRWLPNPLPAHVKVVVSVIPSPYLTALQRQLPAENLIEIPSLAQHVADILLDKWLADAGRTLQSHQRHEVMTKFAHTGLPLYLKLAFEEAKLWRSYDTITPLQEDILALIRYNLFGRLSDNAEHGELLVNRSMAYLRASRNGLTEDEILELLRRNEIYWQDFYTESYHKEALDVIGGVPIVIWSRLYFDLAPYMTQRSADNTELWAFFHRQFNEVVDATYLGEDVRKDHHAHLARYFMGQELYLGDIPNARKVSEQAYQQATAGMKDEYVATLTDYHFLKVSVMVRGVLALIEDYELLNGDEILLVLKEAFILSSGVLVSQENQFSLQLAGRLWLYKNKPVINKIWRKAIDDSLVFIWAKKLPNPPLEPAGGTLKKILRHNAIIRCVAYSNDGTKVASGTSDSLVLIWDLDTGLNIQKLVGHTQKIRAVSWHQDGKRLASASADKTIRIWDVESGEPLLVLIGHDDEVWSVSWHQDGKRLASASADKTIRIWDVESSESLLVLTGHDDVVKSLMWDNAGERLATVSEDRTLRIWKQTGELITMLSGHAKGISSVAWDFTDKRLATGSGDNTIIVWDAVCVK